MRGEQAAGADLVLWVIERDVARMVRRRSRVQAGWLVVNKMDLADPTDTKRIESSSENSNGVHFISSATGAGVDAAGYLPSAGFAERFFTQEPALVTRERQRAHLRETVVALQGADKRAQDGREEIMAEQLAAGDASARPASWPGRRRRRSGRDFPRFLHRQIADCGSRTNDRREASFGAQSWDSGPRASMFHVKHIPIGDIGGENGRVARGLS